MTGSPDFSWVLRLFLRPFFWSSNVTVTRRAVVRSSVPWSISLFVWSRNVMPLSRVIFVLPGVGVSVISQDLMA